MDEDVVLLNATCQSCGEVAEVGYIHGRARVTVTEFLCERCGTRGATTPSSARTSLAPRKRIGPRASPRHGHKRPTAHAN